MFKLANQTEKLMFSATCFYPPTCTKEYNVYGKKDIKIMSFFS